MNISLIQSPGCALLIASIGTSLVCLAHVARLCLQTTILVAGQPVPMWVSAFAVVILGVLSCWFWKLSVAPNLREPPKPTAA